MRLLPANTPSKSAPVDDAHPCALQIAKRIAALAVRVERRKADMREPQETLVLS